MRTRVSVALAMKAKQLGFNEYGTSVWHRGVTYNMIEDPIGWRDGGHRILYKYWNREEDPSCWLPTLNELAEWLRTVHHISVNIATQSLDMFFPVNELLMDDGTQMQAPPYIKNWKTYDEAQVYGIEYALDQMIKRLTK